MKTVAHLALTDLLILCVLPAASGRSPHTRGSNVKVVQESLRHANSCITLEHTHKL
jgi:hypothetical protein